MMKRLWAEALDLVRQGGATHVLLKYTDRTGRQLEVPTSIATLNDDSLETGIHLDNGDLVFPNPTTAVLNPFLAHCPLISFSCDLQRRPDDFMNFNQFDLKDADALSTSEILTLFPEREDDHLRHPIMSLAAEPKMTVAPAVLIQQSSTAPPSPKPTSASKPKRSDSTTSTPGEHRGTSCHQCKNARSLEHLAFCSKLFSKRTSHDMRHCRKKFCQGCLTKFYGDSIENSKVAGWVCPSCRGHCRCAACERKRRKSSTPAMTAIPALGLSPKSNNLGGVGVFSHDVVELMGGDQVRASGGSPSLPDEHVEDEGFVDLAGGKVVKNRRANLARAQPYPSTPSTPNPAESGVYDMESLQPHAS